MHLSAIIPAYNEEIRIKKTLIEIDAYLSRQNYEYEIIVVNDGSKDKTAEVVERLKLQVKNLYLIDNEINSGKGFAVRQGLLEATGEYRLFTDADNSVSINQIERLMSYFNNNYCDVVIASRSMKGSVLDPAQLWHRRFLGDIFSLLAGAIGGLHGIKDTQCGFKIFTSRSVDAIFPKCKINRWAFDVEALILAKKLGYKLMEAPVTWQNGLNSKMNLKGMAGALAELIRIRLNFSFNKYKI